MPPRSCSGDELLDALTAPVEPSFAGELVVVTAPCTEPDPARIGHAVTRLATLPCVVVGGPAELADVAEVDGAIDDIVATFDAAPIASAALALHLRAADRRSIADGLVAESALYSALQAGPEYAAWRSSVPRRNRQDAASRVGVERIGDELRLTLIRAAARNALDRQMRDELLDALAVAEADPDLSVVLCAEGPDFCAGGDLDEFGTSPDPATAHGVRLTRSIGAVLARLAGRTTVHLHGACIGSGIELAAFSRRVVAAPSTVVALPELRMGLIPGAGGTVSLPVRIGRHRTAWLALSGRTLDATTALSQHLVDEIDLF